MAINYLLGDATLPQAAGNKLIIHICNDMGTWGAGFVVALSNRWPEPEENYREWYRSKQDFELGSIRVVQVEHDTWVANMIAQHRVTTSPDGTPPIRYEALRNCLVKIRLFATENNCSVHLPRIGTGIARGKWSVIESMLQEELDQRNVDVTVYDLK